MNQPNSSPRVEVGPDLRAGRSPLAARPLPALPRLWGLATLLAVAISFGVRPAHAAAATVEQWGLFEVALKGPADGNPFLDVRLTASFTDGARTHEINGFYDGDGVYRIRFMPDVPGEWRYETKSNRWPLTDKSGVFTVTPPSKGNHGPVRVHNTFHFAYADDTP